jgi:hypothetical protein
MFDLRVPLSRLQTVPDDPIPHLWPFGGIHCDVGILCVRVRKHSSHPAAHKVGYAAAETSIDLDVLGCSNYRQKSLYGFRASTLIGWIGGDTFK